MHETKNRLLDCINDLDDLLMQYKVVIDRLAGIEIPQELVEGYENMRDKIVKLMVLRKRAAKILFEYHGIIVLNGWES